VKPVKLPFYTFRGMPFPRLLNGYEIVALLLIVVMIAGPFLPVSWGIDLNVVFWLAPIVGVLLVLSVLRRASTMPDWKGPGDRHK